MLQKPERGSSQATAIAPVFPLQEEEQVGVGAFSVAPTTCENWFTDRLTYSLTRYLAGPFFRLYLLPGLLCSLDGEAAVLKKKKKKKKKKKT